MGTGYVFSFGKIRINSGEMDVLDMSDDLGWLPSEGVWKMALGPYNSILQYFEKVSVTDQEKEDMDRVRQKFLELARWIELSLPSNPERTVALRKLLESKDAAVRSRIFKGP